MARQLAGLSLKIRGKMFFQSLYKMLIRFAYTVGLALLESVGLFTLDIVLRGCSALKTFCLSSALLMFDRLCSSFLLCF